MFNPYLHVCLRAPSKSHMQECVLIVCPCVYEKGRKKRWGECVGVQEAHAGGGGVTSKLQKKLIKNEKKEGGEAEVEEEEAWNGRKQLWVDRGGESEGEMEGGGQGE